MNVPASPQTPLNAAAKTTFQAAEFLPLSDRPDLSQGSLPLDSIPADRVEDSPPTDSVKADSVKADSVKAIQIHYIPEPIGHFVGRGRELQAIDRMAAQGIQVVEISDWQGRGGVGKSALAIQAAHYIQQVSIQQANIQQVSPNTPQKKFCPNIQLYANFHGYDPLPRDAKDVLQEFLLLRFGLDPAKIAQDVQGLQQAYQQRLQGQQALILLDNVSSFKQIEPLLPAGDNCLVLLTSRKPVLSGCGETLYLDGMANSAAVQLLQTMVGNDRKLQDSSALRQLLQMSGGLPLTLRLLGAFLRQKPDCTLEMLVLHLQQERLKYKAVSPQSIDLIACLSLMFRNLNPDQQEFLKHLSVLRGDDFDIPIVTYLHAAPEPSQTRAMMKSLIAQQWLFRGIGGRDRFQFHDMARLFIWDTIKPHDRQKLILKALAWQDQQFGAIDKLLMFKQRSAS